MLLNLPNGLENSASWGRLVQAAGPQLNAPIIPFILTFSRKPKVLPNGKVA
jgi:hypothetical protein